MSGWISITATATPSRRPLRAPPTLPASSCAAIASSSMRWSHALPIAEYDTERQHWTFTSAARGCSAFRNYIADVLGVGRDKVRVLTDRVGGSFGMKQATYAEYYCILEGPVNSAGRSNGPTSARAASCRTATAATMT